jgi:hypothetical protein
MIGGQEILREASEFMTRTNLHHGQSDGGTTTHTMEGNFPNMVRDIMQTNRLHNTSSIDVPWRVVYGQLQAF